MLCPVPVTEVEKLRESASLIGERLVVGEPSSGLWLYEQRAATQIHLLHGKQMIGVLAEVDWYRRERDPSYPAVPHAVPVEQVYLELTDYLDSDATPVLSDQSDLSPSNRTSSLVAQPDIPPVRWPRRGDQERLLTGARCWMVSHWGVQRGYRVVGEPRRAETGALNLDGGLEGLDRPVVAAMVPLVHEADWYRWQDTGQQPRPLFNVQSQLIYLE